MQMLSNLLRSRYTLPCYVTHTRISCASTAISQLAQSSRRGTQRSIVLSRADVTVVTTTRRTDMRLNNMQHTSGSDDLVQRKPKRPSQLFGGLTIVVDGFAKSFQGCLHITRRSGFESFPRRRPQQQHVLHGSGTREHHVQVQPPILV